MAETLLNNSGPDKTSAICYAVGWTQHTYGVQMIGTAAMLQLLLGNIGRPGGGIMALRGHATIQGSTDVPTLYHSHPRLHAGADRAQAARHARGVPARPRRCRPATGPTRPSSWSPI